MSEANQQRIHHPTDFSQGSEVAYYHALRLAVAAQADIDIFHVDRKAHAMEWSEFPCVSETLEGWKMLPSGAYGSDLAGVHVEKIAAYGKEPVGPILEHLIEFPADLIVLATHRRQGLDRWLHKEIAQKVARSRQVRTLFVPSDCEGFVSPSTGKVALSKILVAVDWDPDPQAAVDAASKLAACLTSEPVEITLFHVSDDEQDMPAVQRPFHPGQIWHECIEYGEVVDTIREAATDADLIVMTTQGHDGFLDLLRGSTTERVLRYAQCPVLAVPAAEYD